MERQVYFQVSPNTAFSQVTNPLERPSYFKHNNVTYSTISIAFCLLSDFNFLVPSFLMHLITLFELGKVASCGFKCNAEMQCEGEMSTKSMLKLLLPHIF